MNSSASNEEHERLFAAICDGWADEHQRARLSQLLAVDPEVRDAYLKYVDLHAALAAEIVPSVESDVIDYRSEVSLFADASQRPQRPENSNHRRFAGLSAAVAAGMLGTVLAVWLAVVFWWAPGRSAFEHDSDGRSTISPDVAAAAPVASMVLADDCEWSGFSPEEGQLLPAGSIELISGTAMLRMAGGAEVMLFGPTSIDLRTAGTAAVDHGKVLVRAVDDAEGFTVLTPNSEVVDLGTEFAVEVAESGDTRVDVLEGLVRYRSRPDSPPTSNEKQSASPITVRAGEAVEASQALPPRQGSALTQVRFREALERATHGRPNRTAAVVESFDYESGVLPIEQADGGTGWGGSWRLRSSDERRFGQAKRTDERPELLIASRSDDAGSGILSMPPGLSCYVRPLAKPIRMDRDAITYVTVRLRRSAAAVADADIDLGFRVTLRSSADYFGRWICGGMDAEYQPYVQTGGGVGGRSATTLDVDRPSVWVLKIVSRREPGDAVFFRAFVADQSLPVSEPAAWHIAVQNLDLAVALDRFLLSCAGSRSFEVHEVRVGPTWRSVIGEIGNGKTDQ